MFALVPMLMGLPRRNPAQTWQHLRDVKPAISITLSTRQTVVEVGSPLKVRIAITNMSDHDVFLGGHIQMIVQDSEGKPVPQTPYGKKVYGTEPPSVSQSGIGPGGGDIGAPLMRPGDTITGSPQYLNKEYDLSKPGTYTIQARRNDPYSQSVVQSNVLTVTLIGSAKAPERPTTSFTLSISTDEDTVKPGDKISLLTEVTNTSDHEIVYDMAYSKLDIQVRDAEGNMASLTEGGREFRKQFGRAGSLYNLQDVKPGDSVYGRVAAVQELYDMSRPGDYTIQVSQFDDETKTWVKSNTITVTVMIEKGVR